MMKIAIIKCDRVDPELAALFGEYPTMFVTQLQKLSSDLSFSQFDALEQQLPQELEQFDGYIITGSRHNAYDNDPWILNLMNWVQQADQAKARIAGICFGHQLIARALGGRVAKSAKGWGLGSTQVDIRQSPAWIQDAPSQLTLWVSHQDQVESVPDDLMAIAGNNFCPNFMLVKDSHIFTVQGHPEFTQGYTQKLLEKHTEQLSTERRAQINASMHAQVQSDIVLQWILRLFAQPHTA
ncbi:glutamine amidotransferase-related protein [Celerinatantimonas sp. YJH-8]|uniref:glutamine amidotransferase-related protein n=1 Tax=Celerinatantimonas sp. YJH-8 TaxID=3228714 RepID=UPI0038CB4A2F